MRLYSKRIIRKRVDRRVEAKRETRDAIVWDVLPSDNDRKCRVKIQGSNQLIVAHYPFNWGTQPEFVKPGNSVKINHQGGARGKIEVVGHGQLVPTAVSGGDSPDPDTEQDGILSGLTVHEMPDPDDMRVWVKVGTYRIDGVLYTLDPMTMEELTDAGFGDALLLGTVGAVVAIDTAPSIGWFRQDLISVGIDGVVDSNAGTNATTNPAPDAVDASHLELATVLVYGTMTVITNQWIDAKWTAPFLAYVRASVDDDELDWQSESSAIITVTAYDQYSVPFSRHINQGGILFSCEIVIQGNGTLSYAVTSTYSEVLTSGSSIPFTYTRGNGSDDVSPYFECACNESYKLVSMDFISIKLNDGLGDLM